LRIFSTLVRRPDITRQAFHAHYEGNHTPLALPLMTGLVHYLRNHIALVLGGQEPYFDTLSEFGYEGPEAFQANIDTMGSERGAPVRADELTFMDKPNNHFFEVRPAGGLESKGTAVPGGVKAVLMARAPAGIARPDFLASHGRSLEGILEKAASWSHWETHPALGVPPVCDVVTLVWFPPEAFDPGALRAWSPEAETTWRFRSDERVSRRTDG
jgi:uncharacterized protein (TIGR02118 family)